jgi:hypothetical protein
VLGSDPQDKPIAYTKTAEFQNLGMYGESEDVAGGMDLEKVGELRKFVNAGGVLMTLGQATTLPADFGLVRGINAGRLVRCGLPAPHNCPRSGESTSVRRPRQTRGLHICNNSLAQ